MQIKKKFIASLLAVTTFVSSCLTLSVFGVSITEKQRLMKGVEYKHTQMLSESGWQDIHIITADLSEPHLAFKVLSDSRGGSYLLNTLEMAKESDAIAAINADFFAAKRGQAGRGSAVGMEMSEGELKTTPSVAEKMNVLYQLKDGERLFLNRFNFDITLTAPNGKTDKVRHINKYDDLTEICIYTPDWGEVSPGSEGGIMEVVVENGKVTQKLAEQPGIKIPENGFVIASHLSYNTFILDNLNVGDEVKVDIKSTPDFTQIKNAVSGGGVLVSEGLAQTAFSHVISGRHPRSAVGIDKSGLVITLVAVDGRRDEAKGMTMEELADFMAGLGCEYALNLDGGGSTLITAKKDDEHIVLNTPSDGAKRAVTNSIGIVSDVPLGETAMIDIESPENVFCGTKTEIKVIGYDNYYRKTDDMVLSDVMYVVETENGYMEGNKFCATSEGTARVSAYYGGAHHYVDINVLDTPHRIEFETEDITLLSGETYNVKITGYDKNGFSSEIDSEYITFNMNGDCAVVENGVITAKTSGSAVISATFKDVTSYAAVCIDGAEKPVLPLNITLKDAKQKEAELTGDDSFRFTVFGKVTPPKTLIEYIALNRSVSSIQRVGGEFHAFLGEVDRDLAGDLIETSFLAKGHSVFTHNGSTFVVIKSDKGDIFSSDEKQWESIENAVMDAYGKNLFVFIDDISISWFNTEKRIFDDMMQKAVQKGTNVFVFGGGAENYVRTTDGVRYIETAGIFNNLGTSEGKSDVRNIRYLLVTVNGKDVSFEEKSILN